MHALPNYHFETGEPYFDLEDVVTLLEEGGYITARLTKRDVDMRPEKEIDWRNMMFRISDKGRVALHDALH
jgi:cystathionine beta-lyase family protein involved in aluminum resistance